ncbi:MAG: hypothetical protein ACTSYD_12455 [Candidatus Heimdallarchaeaceae archaeon]
MIDALNEIIPYISGLYTLPWILIGFIVTILIARVIGRDTIDKIMKKIGLVLLYFFVPVLLFRIFLNTAFGSNEIGFAAIIAITIFFMYVLAYLYAKYSIKKQKLTTKRKDLYLKTVLTNQGRSSAFIGSMMLAIESTRVYAAILMAIVGIALFAVVPYLLSHLHKKETKKTSEKIKALPWYLKLYPWYLILFVILAVLVQILTGKGTVDLIGKDADVILRFYTAFTIPAALYYVGAGIHPRDLKPSEIKKLIGIDKTEINSDHWKWVRDMFFLTVIITPIAIGFIFGLAIFTGFIPIAAFAVILINSILPVTSTNMFLIPYGIDKKSTAHIVTWTTIVCVPIVVLLITFFEIVIG